MSEEWRDAAGRRHRDAGWEKWSAFLPTQDRKEFAEELTAILLGSAEIESFVLLGQLLTEWRATAEVHADPKLARRLRRRLSAAGAAVPPPRN